MPLAPLIAKGAFQDYNKIEIMNSEQNREGKSKHYAKISLKRRQQLIDLVDQNRYSIGKAAQRLKLKLSTAKMIVKKYRDNGTFFEKKFALKGNPETKRSVEKIATQSVNAGDEIDEPVSIKHQGQSHQDDDTPQQNIDNDLSLMLPSQPEWQPVTWSQVYYTNPMQYTGFIASLGQHFVYPFLL